MDFVSFLVEHFIELLFIIGFLLCSILFKLYKNKKCYMVYAILGLSSLILIYDFLLKSEIVIELILPIVYMSSFSAYLCCLVVFPINKKTHLMPIFIFLVGVIISLFVEPKMFVMGLVEIVYYLVILVYAIISHKKRNNLFESLIIGIFAIINSICICLQFVYPKTNLLIQMLLISTIVVFLSFIIKEINEAKVEEEKRIQTQRTSIAISQIQPHFLYNSLATIGYICKKDAIKASEAIDKFSDYLRANLNSLRTERNIPFNEELRHVETYLWLEKLRFQDRLEIVFDIGVDDFLVPPLSIQPLVENAVKHGICEKLEGGTLFIRTIDYNQEIKIIIQDTGVGFDTKAIKNDGKTHVGIENVRSRIKNMANGDLTITSEIGKGTTSTITLPKEEI